MSSNEQQDGNTSEKERNLSNLKRHIKLLELADESVLLYQQALEVIKGKFLDAYIIKAKVSFGQRQGIIIFLISKLRKKVLCIQSSFQNGFMTNVVNKFNVAANYSSKELDKEIQDIQSYKNYDEEYSKRNTAEIYGRLSSSLISRFILDLDRDSSSVKIEEMIRNFFISKASKADSIATEIGFEEVASVLYRNNSLLEKNYKKFLNKEVYNEAIPIVDKSERPIQPEIETNIIGKKFSSLYEQNYRNFLFVESIIDPVNGIPIDKLGPESNLYFRAFDQRIALQETDIIGAYKEVVSNEVDDNYYLFSVLNDSILYSIESDLKVKLKVYNEKDMDDSTHKEILKSVPILKDLDIPQIRLVLITAMVISFIFYIIFL